MNVWFIKEKWKQTPKGLMRAPIASYTTAKVVFITAKIAYVIGLES